jgi:hypothetical protein
MDHYITQKLSQALEVRRDRMMFYKITPNRETSGKLFVPKKFLRNKVIMDRDSIFVSAGRKRSRVEVIIDRDLDEFELGMSEDVFDELSIPCDISYQVRLEKNTVKIGPVTGLLMAISEDSLTRVRLKKLQDYCTIYSEVQGLIIALSVEGIDFDKLQVKGYYYNPELKERTLAWKEGVFPLPDSIFQRTDIPEDVRLRLKKETNNRMFNSNYFNKWEFWRMVSRFTPFLGCIPETRLYSSVEDIKEMLVKYDSVYLKPINGTLSRGLYRLTRNEDGYGFQGKQGARIHKVHEGEELEKYLMEIVGNRDYIVQQAVHPMLVNGRHLDFRVIMQKDRTMAWSCTGIVGFVGKQGDICTNWGFSSNFEDTLRKHFNFNQKEIFKKKQELITACKSVCEMLDLRNENYGDLGFDVMIDEELKVWILEVNKRHYHSVPLWINDTHTYYEVKSKPIKYATALGGFDVY